ncbi:hypothetical protein DBP19_25015 [Streptomyces sp. CS090A]|uniref:hypothetical protein n=1 Tax=Streptomyces sp. CS090A TaxID=2162710 RepID=UPI000D513A31|nr:hypothetical protein [Streptomyces sp. CS090A]PVC87812.1 hypothetical protein DBP19_25015 [Streptomyces sp. CS090A]
MNTTPSKTTDPSKKDTPADDPGKSTADAAVTEDPTATATPSRAGDDAAVPAKDRDEAAVPAEATDQAEDGGLEHGGPESDGLKSDGLEPDPFTEARHGVGAGATAVVSAALGIVALTGAWSGRVAAERETLMGQIQTAGGSSAAQQISEIYGDAWHTTALVNGVFAVLALLVGAFVLARPAFGTPATRPQPAWIRAVALAGIALGTLGVLISAGMYFDLFLSLPVAGTPAG